MIFRWYQQSTQRNFGNQNISMMVAGTLIILICTFFLIAGAGLGISSGDVEPNMIVMNAVISCGASGLIICFTNQFGNVWWDENRHQQVQQN